jgi:hypothetical protein
VSLIPDYSNAHYNLAVALTKSGAVSAAAVHFEKVAQSRMTPGSAGAPR